MCLLLWMPHSRASAPITSTCCRFTGLTGTLFWSTHRSVSTRLTRLISNASYVPMFGDVAFDIAADYGDSEPIREQLDTLASLVSAGKARLLIASTLARTC